MTTLSMHAGQVVRFSDRARHAALPAPGKTGLAGALRAAVRTGAGRALAVAGRLTLALVPVSMLAWIFIAH